MTPEQVTGQVEGGGDTRGQRRPLVRPGGGEFARATCGATDEDQPLSES